MKRILVVFMIVVLTMTLCGCKNDSEDELASLSKTELIDYAHQLESSYNIACEKIAGLEEKVQGAQQEEVQSSGVQEFSDGSGKLTLTTVDGMVKLPGKLEYPNSAQSYNASSVQISDYVKIKPSANWIISISGTEINFQHTKSKISGVIKVGLIDKSIVRPTPDELMGIVTDFYKKLPPENVKLTKLYTDSNICGYDGEIRLSLREEE